MVLGAAVRDLTIVLPYFQNGGMLREHQTMWRTFADDLKAHFHVIVVDDVSPKNMAIDAVEPCGIASFRIYRNVGKKVRWNWLFSRNLGVQEANTEWVLLTDIDHAIPEETCRSLMTMPLDQKNVYRLARVDAFRKWPYRIKDCPVRPDKRYHPNTWLMTRDMYEKTGGYDERLSGCYGTDGEYRDRVKNAAKAIVLLPDVMVRYPREIIPDASTPPELLTRKGDMQNDAELRRRRDVRSQLGKWKPERITFPWVKQLELSAEVPA